MSSIDLTAYQIAAKLRAGETVRIVGFGTFKVKDVPERTHRNPKTGASVVKAPHKVVKFKATLAI